MLLGLENLTLDPALSGGRDWISSLSSCFRFDMSVPWSRACSQDTRLTGKSGELIIDSNEIVISRCDHVCHSSNSFFVSREIDMERITTDNASSWTVCMFIFFFYG